MRREERSAQRPGVGPVGAAGRSVAPRRSARRAARAGVSTIGWRSSRRRPQRSRRGAAAQASRRRRRAPSRASEKKGKQSWVHPSGGRNGPSPHFRGPRPLEPAPLPRTAKSTRPHRAQERPRCPRSCEGRSGLSDPAAARVEEVRHRPVVDTRSTTFPRAPPTRSPAEACDELRRPPFAPDPPHHERRDAQGQRHQAPAHVGFREEPEVERRGSRPSAGSGRRGQTSISRPRCAGPIPVDTSHLSPGPAGRTPEGRPEHQPRGGGAERGMSVPESAHEVETMASPSRRRRR
jgi:hypothetical protein